MSRPTIRVIERLEKDEFTRVLDDLLDKNRLARLAVVCGLKYPGMRIRSIARDKLIADLVEKAQSEASARSTVERTLQRETRAAVRSWSALGPEEKAARLADDSFLLADGNLGLHLYLLTRSEPDPPGGFENLLARQRLARMVEADVRPAARGGPRPSRSENRLKKRIVELEKKTQRLEGQLAKSRDDAKTIKSELIQRKGDLAETRMLAERLRRELSHARAEAAKTASPKTPEAPSVNGVEQLNRTIRKLTAEQKKLVHRIEKLATESGAAAARGPDSSNALSRALKALQKELKGAKQEREAQVTRLDELRKLLSAQKKAGARAPKRPRTAKEAKRLGVFIDVQNVYYGARKLKGKLDFDALLEAAVGGRRLIQSTAYVVESKEIDQSGFIARLEQRAIEVRRKRVRVRADGSRKGDWDMELALDVLDATPRLDVVVLVSGDGDFTSLVRHVKRAGPRVEVIGFPRNTAKSLIEAADHFQPLDRKFMIYTRGAAPATQPANQ